ncbi:MAG TPA: SIS domain-containing protein [Candidatus Limnocylindrales bacterium]|nr:SIS domain-containing protein [Candidatus Limnocylindrales bacterium]
MTTDTSAPPPFDPSAPLAAAPDPWASTDQPSLRAGPPYHMTDMIAAEPHLAARLLDRLARPDSGAAALAGAVAEAATAGQSIVVTGCGTSEHGAIGVAAILRDGLRRSGRVVGPGTVVAAQAFEAALDPQPGGLVIGVSHEGGTAATNRSLEAARAAGAHVAIITVTGRSPGGRAADIVVETDEMDASWCHTIGYLSPLLAAAAVAGHVAGQPVDGAAASRLLAAGAAEPATAEAIAVRLAARSHLIVIASGADRAAGRELVLKIEEAAWVPSAYRDLETFLHGHLPATGESTGLVLVLAARDARVERVARARGALVAARGVGIETAAILAADASAAIPADLASAGRLIVPEAPELPAPVAALLGTATALQLLTERIARARGTNPDPIRRDDPRYAAAADAAEGA